MFSIAHTKIRPIVSLPIDQSEKEWNIDVKNIKESFLFLKRGEIICIRSCEGSAIK